MTGGFLGSTPPCAYVCTRCTTDSWELYIQPSVSLTLCLCLWQPCRQRFRPALPSIVTGVHWFEVRSSSRDQAISSCAYLPVALLCTQLPVPYWKYMGAITTCPTFTASSRLSDPEGQLPRQAERRHGLCETLWEEIMGVPGGKEGLQPDVSVIWVSRRGKLK